MIHGDAEKAFYYQYPLTAKCISYMAPFSVSGNSLEERSLVVIMPFPIPS